MLVTGCWIKELKGNSPVTGFLEHHLTPTCVFVPITLLIGKIPLPWLGIILWPKFTLGNYNHSSSGQFCPSRQRAVLPDRLYLLGVFIGNIHNFLVFTFLDDLNSPGHPDGSFFHTTSLWSENETVELQRAMYTNPLNSGVSNSYPSASSSFEVS